VIFSEVATHAPSNKGAPSVHYKKIVNYRRTKTNGSMFIDKSNLPQNYTRICIHYLSTETDEYNSSVNHTYRRTNRWICSRYLLTKIFVGKMLCQIVDLFNDELFFDQRIVSFGKVLDEFRIKFHFPSPNFFFLP